MRERRKFLRLIHSIPPPPTSTYKIMFEYKKTQREFSRGNNISEGVIRKRSGGKEKMCAAQKRRAEYPVSYNLQRLSVRPGTECIPGTETETESAS